MNTYALPVQLPWSSHPADSRRFRRIVGTLVFIMATVSLLIAQIKLPVIERVLVENTPTQIQEVTLIEKISPVPVETKPDLVPPTTRNETVKPSLTPTAAPTKKTQQAAAPKQDSQASATSRAKTQAQGQINTFSNMLSQISSLPQAQAPAQVNTLHSTQPETTSNVADKNEDRINGRANLAQKVGKGMDSTRSAGETRLAKQTLSDSGLTQSSKQQLAQRQSAQQLDSKSLPPKNSASQRSRESIQAVFDQNKSAIYAIYNRALRSQPDLQGKIVFFLAIDAQGHVTECRIVSSEIKDSELSQKLIARIKLFNFGAINGAQVWRDTFFLDFIPT